MKLIMSAMKVFKMSYEEVLNMGFAQLTWLFKENNDMYKENSRSDENIKSGTIDDLLAITKGK